MLIYISLNIRLLAFIHAIAYLHLSNQIAFFLNEAIAANKPSHITIIVASLRVVAEHMITDRLTYSYECVPWVYEVHDDSALTKFAMYFKLTYFLS